MTSSTAASAPHSIGLLLGSLRQNGNNAGLANWITNIAQRTLATYTPDIHTHTDTDTARSITRIFPFPSRTAATTDSSHRRRYPGPVIDPVIPQTVATSADYPSPLIRQWSTSVRACAAFIVVTPQYNWGVPGELKNAIDHLYDEWTGKPVIVVTYGGHGGARCDEQLRVVLGGGLKMRTIEEKVQITLPREFITGERRVGDGGDDSFLDQYEAALKKAVTGLSDMLQPASANATVTAAALGGATEAAEKV